MKFPYGICDFEKILMNDYFYVDRTDKIPLVAEFYNLQDGMPSNPIIDVSIELYE